MRIQIALISAVLIIVTTAGCAEKLPAPPPPTITLSFSPTASPSSVPPLSTGKTDLQVSANEATVSFPDRISFSLTAQAPIPVKSVFLEYGTDQRTLTPQVRKAQANVSQAPGLTAAWSWELKKTGSIPPGTTVWWRWEVLLESDATVSVPRQTIQYTDTRFSWTNTETDFLDIYWAGQTEELKRKLTEGIGSKLSRVELKVTIPDSRRPKVFIYRTSEDLRGAVLHEQEWMGAVAFTTFNIILTAVDEQTLEWATQALPHEITHLMVAESLFGPFGDVPTWLNEGLAECAAGPLDAGEQRLIQDALQSGILFTLRSLSSNFPADPLQARLAYAESASVVAFLIERDGWQKARDVLQLFKDGTAYDDALKQVYSFDMSGLEAQWKETLRNR